MFICILPKIALNYIAAGEVIHCSASVVKELIENSIDAGSTSIDIDVENGELNLINIRDNSCRICKEDLVLSLSRYSTSKIYSIQDLESVTTLGFRGEELASINSVSRLILSSCHCLEQKKDGVIHYFGQNLRCCLQPIEPYSRLLS
ncbi:MAG: ATP-binding protein [Buchnera aphidicola (Melaphis rhois)]